MDALYHQPFGLVRQPSGCCVRLLALGTTKAFVAFLTSLGWRTSAAPTHYWDTLLVSPLLKLVLLAWLVLGPLGLWLRRRNRRRA